MAEVKVLLSINDIANSKNNIILYIVGESLFDIWCVDRITYMDMCDHCEINILHN